MKFRINMTSPERHSNSKMPDTLRHLLYGNKDLLDIIEWTGCPNTGCEHSFTIEGERADVTAWLQLFKDQYPRVSDEVFALLRAIHLAFVKDADKDVTTIHLKKIERSFIYNARTITRPWYWTESWEKEDEE